MLLEIAEGAESVVEDGGGEGGVGVSFAEDFDEVWGASGTSGGDDWDVQAIGDGASQFTIEAGGGAVTVQKSGGFLRHRGIRPPEPIPRHRDWRIGGLRG